MGREAERLFIEDVRDGRCTAEWYSERDLVRAAELNAQYVDLHLGLVDTIVIAMAERLRARAIVTLDLRDFAAVEILGAPRLFPRDL